MLQGYRQEKGKSSSSAQSPLSFEQVCPRWASKIRQGLDEHDVHTLVHDSKYCIVGEAWHFWLRDFYIFGELFFLKTEK
jgi:hypothetical protein